MHMAALSFATIYEVVCRIPAGSVASYGQIAGLCGFPRHARQVGYAMAALPDNTTVPWHRVINSQGRISQRRVPGGDEYQRLLLEDEGVEFALDGCIDLGRYQWQPGA